MDPHARPPSHSVPTWAGDEGLVHGYTAPDPTSLLCVPRIPTPARSTTPCGLLRHLGELEIDMRYSVWVVSLEWIIPVGGDWDTGIVGVYAQRRARSVPGGGAGDLHSRTGCTSTPRSLGVLRIVWGGDTRRS